MTLSRAVSPSDCGLALAIPLEREQLFDHLRTDSGKEYAKLYRASRGGDAITAEALWSLCYEPDEVTRIRKVMRSVAELGVEVVPRCSRATLGELARRKPVVSLVAHWRSGRLTVADLPEVGGFCRRLLDSAAALVTRLRSLLSDEELAAAVRLAGQNDAGVAADGSDTAMLLDGINQVLRECDLQTPSRSPLSWSRESAQLVAANRQALEAELPEIVPAGAGLELDDGTYGPTALAGVFPQGYDGVLELIGCHSAIPADVIKREHPDCRVLSNRDAVAATVHLFIYRAVIRELARKRRSYADLSFDLRIATARAMERR
jgi:hypothetical protein